MNVLLLNWTIGAICGAQRYAEELATGFSKCPNVGVELVDVDEATFWDEWGGSVPTDYDLYVFTDSVPQEWKGDDYGRWWMDLYHQLTEAVVFAVVHDIWWENERGWMRDVLDAIDLVVAPQEPVERSLESMPAETALIRHPLDTDRMDLVDDKRRLIVSASQIHPRKHVDHLVREVPNLDYDVIVHSDRTWEFERMAGVPENRAPEYGDIWERAIGHGMQFVGVTSTEELWEHYRQARFVVDLQSEPGWEHVINYTQLEPMLFGAVPIVYRDVVNPIMEPHVLLLDHHSELPDLVGGVSEADLRRMRRANAEFLVETFEAATIAEQFLDRARRCAPDRFSSIT